MQGIHFTWAHCVSIHYSAKGDPKRREVWRRGMDKSGRTVTEVKADSSLFPLDEWILHLFISLWSQEHQFSLKVRARVRAGMQLTDKTCNEAERGNRLCFIAQLWLLIFLTSHSLSRKDGLSSLPFLSSIPWKLFYRARFCAHCSKVIKHKGKSPKDGDKELFLKIPLIKESGYSVLCRVTFWSLLWICQFFPFLWFKCNFLLFMTWNFGWFFPTTQVKGVKKKSSKHESVKTFMCTDCQNLHWNCL